MDLFRGCAICVILSSACLPLTLGQIPEWLSNELGGLEGIEDLANMMMNIVNIPFSMMDIFQLPNEISEVCVNDVKYTLTELLAAKTWSNITNSWAVRMLDSMGKPPSGIMSGNLYWMGKFQQCLEVVATEMHSSSEKFIGEYCMLKLHFKKLLIDEFKHMPVDLHIGMCLPSTCSPKDKSLLMNYTFGLLKESVDVSITEELCQTKHEKPMDTTTIVLMCIILALVLIVMVATLADMLTPTGSRTAHNSIQTHMTLLDSFSAIRNLKALFQVNENSELSAINGLRVLSSYWILIGHTISYTVGQYPWKNQLDVLPYMDNFFSQSVSFACTYAVTTFFTISGFLATYNFLMKSRERNQTPNILSLYMQRYLRLTLPLIVVLMFLSGPCYHLHDGPMRPYVYESTLIPCRSHWWKSITYIQNILVGERECLLDTWYLSADIQLFLLASIILCLLHKKPFMGVLLMGAIFGASTAYSTYYISINQVPTFLGRNTDIARFKSFFGNMYLKTFYHAPSYVIGMTTGYLYYVIKTNRISLNKSLTTPAWICSLTTLLLIIYGPYEYFKGSSVMGPWMNIAYGVLGRPAWALGISWIILACALGHGGVLNWIFTRPIFTVMGRLTYGVFLTHSAVLSYYFLGNHDGLYFRLFNVLSSTISNFVISLMVALVLTLLIEAPTMNILKQFEEKKTAARPIVKQD